MPNPEINSIGCYAQEALRNAGLWSQVEAKTVYPQSSAAVLGLVRSGEADAAVIYETCLIETYTPHGAPKETKAGIDHVCHVDEQLRGPIPCSAGILRGAGNPSFAQEFIDLLLSPSACQILEEAGFHPLGLSEGQERGP